LRAVTALTGVAWALGETVGAALAGAGADRFGDAAVLLPGAGIVLVAVPVVLLVSNAAGSTPGFSRPPEAATSSTEPAATAPLAPRIEDAAP
jgi:hypothetical protein